MQAIKTMKALVIDGPKKVRYGQRDLPHMGPDEVLVRVHFVGVCATDLEIYEGSMVYYQNGMAAYPIIPGHEWAGEIVQVGEAVQGFTVGDRVVGETTISCGHCETCSSGRYNLCPSRLENGVLGKNGACAEYMVYPAHALHRIDPSLSYEEAALIETAAVAYRGVEKLKVTPHDSVAVIGAGPVGLLSIQMAKAFGAGKVTLIDYQENRLELGKRLGADEVIDLGKEPGHQPRQSFSALIEATGNPAAVESIFVYALPAARVCLLGLCGGRQARMDVDKLVTYDMEVHGSLGSPGVWKTVIKLLESGRVNTREIITHIFPLEDMEQAFELMQQKDPRIVKILLNVQGGSRERG